jgi:hypothetical protein
MGETVAHLNYLVTSGALERHERAGGVHEFVSA